MPASLAELIHTLRPRLNPGFYAFCPLLAGTPLPPEAVSWFREDEDNSVIVPVAFARAAGWPVSFEAAWVTLTVESDLAAVGLTAAVSTALANEGIACNVVAALRHDHLFVPAERAGDTVRILTDLSVRTLETS